MNDIGVITRFQRKVAVLLLIRQVLAFSAVWAFVWGVAVIASRVAAGVSREWLAWGVLGFIPTVILAAIHSRKKVPDASSLRAAVDQESHAGGLVMAASEADTAAWRETIASPAAPRLRWRAERQLVPFIAAIAFLVFTFALPSRFVTTSRPLDVSKEVSRLQEKVETLKEEKLIEPEKAEALEQALAEVEKTASGDDPSKAWEALDKVDETAQAAADKAAESILQKTEQLTTAEMMAEGLAANASSMKPEELTKGMKELSDQMKEAAGGPSPLNAQLPQQLKAPSISSKDLQQIAEAARTGKGNLSKALEKLGKSGMIDPKAIARNGKLGEYKDKSALANYLRQNLTQQTLQQAIQQFKEGQEQARGQGQQPGSGGVSRGRGDAPMTFGDESDPDGAKFKEQTLPPAEAAALASSDVLGFTASSPQTDPATGGSETALGRNSSGNASGYTQTVLPRHRGTVGRYFKRED